MNTDRVAARTIAGMLIRRTTAHKHTIPLICDLNAEIQEIEAAIQAIMEELHFPTTTIPGTGYLMGVHDPGRGRGLLPVRFSGQLKNGYPHMEKRGSRYLRYALYNAAKYGCHWDAGWGEGKRYNVALSHAAKKLMRLLFALEKSALLPSTYFDSYSRVCSRSSLLSSFLSLFQSVRKYDV